MEFRAHAHAVATGDKHTCAIGSFGKLQCWGWDNYGQASVPEQCSDEGGGNWMLAAGDRHTCVIQVKERGSRPSNFVSAEDLEDIEDSGDETEAGVGAIPSTNAASSIADINVPAHPQFKLHCWGSNADGQTEVPAGEELRQELVDISLGDAHTCTVRKGGSIDCWGWNVAGQCDVHKVKRYKAFFEVAAGGEHSCALAGMGIAACWGSDSHGQSSARDEDALLVRVASGFAHSCALETRGTVQCWGWRLFEQTEVPQGRAMAKWAAVATGDKHTCAAMQDGQVECWGWDLYGQCQAPTTLNQRIQLPTLV